MAAFILCFSVILVSHWTWLGAYTWLVRLQYREHRAEWEAAGRPSGMFSNPPGSNYWLGDWNIVRTMFSWFVELPDWMIEMPKAHKIAWLMRVSITAEFLSFAGMFLLGTIWPEA